MCLWLVLENTEYKKNNKKKNIHSLSPHFQCIALANACSIALVAAVHSHYGFTIRQTVQQNKHPAALWKRSVGHLNSGKTTTDRHTNIWLIKTACNQVKCTTEFAKATDEQVALMALRWSPLYFSLSQHLVEPPPLLPVAYDHVDLWQPIAAWCTAQATSGAPWP